MRLPIIPLLAAGVTLGSLAAQDSTIVIPSEVTESVGRLLPDSNNSGTAFLSSGYSPNLVIAGDTTLSVTFIHEGAGYFNSLGYFTYSENVDGSINIIDSNLIIANASYPSAGSAQTGHTYDLRNAAGAVRTFTSGEQVGFFVVADGFRTEPLITSWDPNAVAIPGDTPSENRQFGRGCYTSIASINREYPYSKELARHVAGIHYDAISGFNSDEEFFLFGFEDLNRLYGSDDDFNDLVFLVTCSDFSNLDTSANYNHSEGDLDNDGVPNESDDYPDDADRAFLVRTPSAGKGVLGLEDLYPSIGDADYNDAVISYHYELTKNAAGEVVDLMGEFNLVARGAALDHEFALHLEGVPDGTTGSITLERFESDLTNEVVGPNDLTGFFTDEKRVTVIPSTLTALPPADGDQFTNVRGSGVDRPAAGARIVLTFDQPIAEATLGAVPYDPFFMITKFGHLVDIHLPGKPAFSDRNAVFPEESGPEAFLDDNGYPWILALPNDWRFPLEFEPIWEGYDQFNP